MRAKFVDNHLKTVKKEWEIIIKLKIKVVLIVMIV